jgi:hypothetical protein
MENRMLWHIGLQSPLPERAAMNHSYFLIATLILTAGLAAAIAVRQDRWFVLASGVLATPAGLADGIFVPEYWLPVHLIGPTFSLEGMMFSFGNGCLIAAILLRQRSQFQLDYPGSIAPSILRLSAAMMIGFVAFLFVWEESAGLLMIMHAAFFGFIAMSVFLWRRGHFSMDLAVIGGLGFALVYAVELLVWYAIDPNFTGYWASGRAYLFILPFPPGLPIEELLWAFAYGALWSNLMIYGFGKSSGATRRIGSP